MINITTTANYSKGTNITFECTAFSSTNFNNSNPTSGPNTTINNSLPFSDIAPILTQVGLKNITVSCSVLDGDGGGDIFANNLSYNFGTCVQNVNSTSGYRFTQSYNCTGLSGQNNLNATCGFTDKNGSYAQSSTVNLTDVATLYFPVVTNISGTQVTVNCSVADGAGGSNIAVANISTSGSNAILSNASSGVLFWQLWNVTGLTAATSYNYVCGFTDAGGVYSGNSPTNTNTTSGNDTFATIIQPTIASINSTVIWTQNVTAAGANHVCSINLSKLNILAGLTNITNSTGSLMTNTGNDSWPNWTCNSSASQYRINFTTEGVTGACAPTTVGGFGTTDTMCNITSQASQNVTYNMTAGVFPDGSTGQQIYLCTNSTLAICATSGPFVSIGYTVGPPTWLQATQTSNETMYIISSNSGGGGSSGGGGGGETGGGGGTGGETGTGGTTGGLTVSELNQVSNQYGVPLSLVASLAGMDLNHLTPAQISIIATQNGITQETLYSLISSLLVAGQTNPSGGAVSGGGGGGLPNPYFVGATPENPSPTLQSLPGSELISEIAGNIDTFLKGSIMGIPNTGIILVLDLLLTYFLIKSRKVQSGESGWGVVFIFALLGGVYLVFVYGQYLGLGLG